MKQADEIKIAWLIWTLLSFLNDILWDRYEQEFFQLSADSRKLQQLDWLVAHLKGHDLPF